MKRQALSRQSIIVTLVVVIALIGILLVASDWEEISQVLAQADWRPLLGALLFTGISYLCVSYAFAFVSRMLGIRMGYRELAEVCFVSTTINHVLTTGGVVGYSIRYFLMKMYGVKTKDVLTASILHFYLTSLDMLGMLPVGFIYLLLNARVAKGVAVILGLITMLGALIFLIATGLIFFPSKRGPLLDFLARLVRRLVRKDIRPTLNTFDETLTRGASAIRDRPLTLVIVMILTALDFVSSVIVLGFCFDALGPQVRFGVLLTGFVIGIMAGVLSMVPGGIGVQEGSMAGIFLLLGTSFSQAVLAAILFRVIYYILPYFASLAFYGRLVRQAEQQAEIEQAGGTP